MATIVISADLCPIESNRPYFVRSGPESLFHDLLSRNHTHTAEDLRQCGRNVEQVALARALKLVFEDRVMLCGNRTVIVD